MPLLPRVLCRGWISPSGYKWECRKPVIQPGEPGGRVEMGQCRRCDERQQRAWERKAALRMDRTRRRLAGLEPPDPSITLPADAFAGFREEEQ